jgi:hypothetical protein
MKYKILFSEQQKFSQPWLWIMIILMLGIPGIFIFGVIQQVGRGIPWGNNPLSNTGLVICAVCVTIIIVLSIILFLIVRLETTITEKEIGVRFYPFHRSFRYYKWEDISSASVQKFNPLKYGGWGMKSNVGWGFRVGPSGIKLRFPHGKNMIYNVAGNKVLQLELKDGKKLWIGTQKPLELENIVRKIKQINKEY